MLFIILGKKIKTTQEGTQMQGESLKIVSNFFSCWEQLVGRKWSPEPLPFPPHFPLPSQQWSLSLVFYQLSGFLSVFWFSTPLPLLTPLFLISPSVHSQEDKVHLWLNMNTRVTQFIPWCIASLVPAKWAPQKDSGHSVLIQLSYSTILLDLLFSHHFSAQGQVSPYRSLWILQSCGCLRAQPGAGHLTLQQNRGKKSPDIFHSPLGLNCFSVEGCNHTGLLSYMSCVYSIQPLFIFFLNQLFQHYPG